MVQTTQRTPTHAKKEHGYKTEVYLLRLDAIYAQEPFETDEFHGGRPTLEQTPHSCDCLTL